MTQAHATYGEIEEVWFGGYVLVFFGPFAWAQSMRATKWVRDGTLVTPQAYGGDFVSKISTQNNFYTLGDCGLKFLSEPFFSF